MTHDLGSTTRHLQRLAPHRSETQRALTQPTENAALMEDGHVSRREDAFRKEMSQYRVALKQQRAADQRKAHLATQELAQLPAQGGAGGGETSPRSDARARGRDWHQDQHKVFGALLHEPQNGWDADGPRAYTDMQRRVLAAGARAGRERRGEQEVLNFPY